MTLSTTIRTNSGIYFDLSNPLSNQITIHDIASALSKICRFGGQINRFYSVAEHSVLCASIALEDGHSKNICLALLLHDATEAYIGDMVRPLKRMLPEFSVIENRLASEIARAFGVDFHCWKEIISSIDDALLLAERRQLFSPDDHIWEMERTGTVKSLTVQCQCWSPEVACQKFLAAFEELSSESCW